MNKIHHIMLLQYLLRVTSDLEVQLDSLRRNLSLQNADAVDIIDFVETRAAYQMATTMEREILDILSWNIEL